MKTQTVWIASRIEFADGEFEITDQQICRDRDTAESWWNEWLADIGFALEDMGADEEDIETKYDGENLFYEMKYLGDYSWAVVKEVEMVVEE